MVIGTEAGLTGITAGKRDHRHASNIHEFQNFVRQPSIQISVKHK